MQTPSKPNAAKNKNIPETKYGQNAYATFSCRGLCSTRWSSGRLGDGSHALANTPSSTIAAMVANNPAPISRLTRNTYLIFCA
mmetsp:Transcript_10247/g.16598  ORF Transcript_10247/g.16598 Transcript_10247/m.16598 type:complete len:83 (-) Transcript_10247:420-668(-)